MGFDPASRFKLVDQASMLPGKCLITGTTAGQFVDTGVSLNKFDGIFAESNGARVYLSIDAVREMAQGAGLFEDMDRRYRNRVDEAYSQGYLEGLQQSGDIRTAADRITGAADILRGAISYSPGATGSEAPGGNDEPAFVVQVTNGPAISDRKTSGDQGRAVGGQGNGARVLQRSDDVPGDSSNGDGHGTGD